MQSTVGVVVQAVLSIAAPIGAQWLNYPSSDVPRTKDGKVNLSARAPKARAQSTRVLGVSASLWPVMWP